MPYTLQDYWINSNHKAKDSEHRIPFSIGNYYKDEVVCNVVNMDTYHMLLGRRWQYNTNRIYKYKDNVYFFVKDGRKITLGMRRETRPKVSKVEKSFINIGNTTSKLKDTSNDEKRTKVPDKLITLENFKEIILDDLLDGLPSMRDTHRGHHPTPN